MKQSVGFFLALDFPICNPPTHKQYPKRWRKHRALYCLRTGQATKTDEFSENFQFGIQGGGGGSFSIQKFMLQILDLYIGLFLVELIPLSLL